MQDSESYQCKILTDRHPVKILEEKGQPCIVFKKMFIFSKKNGNSQLETYLFFNSNFVFFKFRNDLLIYYFKQNPPFPL